MQNKTLLKILSAFLAVVMVLLSVPLSGFVGIELPDLFTLKAEAEEYTEGNFIYSVSNGEATLIGCIDATGDIVIPEILGGYPVTSIGNYAFENCTSLASVTIGNSVTSIGNYAFYECTSLKSIAIPDSVANISSAAFRGCTGLTSVTIPNSVTRIEDDVFYNCTYLETVTIPDSVTYIGSSAFFYCSDLVSITIPDSVTYIGSSAFSCCYGLEEVYYTGDIESWLEISFDDSGSNPMYNAENFYIDGTVVENVVIPDGVTAIKSNTFCGFDCIKSVTIPESVVTIYEDAFYECDNIEEIYYTGTDEQWDEIIIYDGNDDLFNEPETKVEVKVNDIKLNYKGTGKINPEISASGEYEVTFISLDPSVVTVDKDGNVTATGEGETAIWLFVKDANGNRAMDTCTVTVAKAWWQWLIIIFLFGWIWY